MPNENKRKFPLNMNLQLFADEPPIDPPIDPPVDPPKKLELTQEEFDAKIEERLARERKKYAGHDEMKTKLAALEQAEEDRKKAEMSDKERADADTAAAIKRAEDAEADRDRALTAANQRLINAEFRAVARELNVRPDALDDALKLADLTSIKVDEEGNVVGVKDAVQALITNKPYLVEKPKPKNIGGPNGDGDEKPDKTKEQLLKEAAEKARKSGRIEDRIAYADLKEELSK
ncbi:scaffolding protein [Cohnella silvisoli]|uniref:Scaffolding protein n=1 Tax=Cohnella silvisoli TaxID=2873699 RepID=A0ABV1L0G2_9BACL|nr:scaffolding protein [Cohnella silvisoli]MCD9024322.1 scaffolding protein [Cohnella silvisoli]